MCHAVQGAAQASAIKPNYNLAAYSFNMAARLHMGNLPAMVVFTFLAACIQTGEVASQHMCEDLMHVRYGDSPLHRKCQMAMMQTLPIAANLDMYILDSGDAADPSPPGSLWPAAAPSKLWTCHVPCIQPLIRSQFRTTVALHPAATSMPCRQTLL